MRLRILLAVLAIAALAAAFKFSAVKQDLAAQQRSIQEQWAQVDSAMLRHATAIPSLLTLVQDGEHGPRELDDEIRNLAAAKVPVEKIRAHRELSLALAKVLLRCETDPLPRVSAGFKRLREQLAAHEDEIANARFQYNNAIEHYNARMQRFPDNVVASLAGFSRDDAYFGTGPDTAPAHKAPN